MEMETALNIARAAGFEVAAPLDPGKLSFRTEVRDMCAANKCGQYGKRWSCPPACGTLDEIAERCAQYQDGVLFQTICRMEDEFDYETISEGMKLKKEAMKKLLDALVENKENVLPFGSDGCGNCTECTYPETTCRFPGKAFPSMEACGLMVSDVCKDNDVPYYYGKNTVAFTGGFLFNPKNG
jgi:predicted metal-binding protein